MEIADLFRIVFYLWLFVALGVWGYRIYNKIARRGEAPADGDAPAEKAPADGPTTKTKGRAKDAASSLTKIASPKPKPKPTPLSAADEPGDLVKAVIREELEKKRRLDAGETQPAVTAASNDDADTGSQRSGLFASSDTRVTTSVTVAEALAGIELPCELVPTLMQGDEVDPYRAAFVTSGFSPRTVAAKFADELERLEYTIRTDADNVAIGSRGATKVRVEVFEDAATARVDDQRLFPYVANGSIAIVVST